MGLTEKDNGWKAFRKSLASLGDLEVLVGIPGEINFSVPTQAAIGAVHEFGSVDGRVPERSFLRSTFDVNEQKYTKMLEEAVKKQVKTKTRDAGALFKLGEIARGDVINRIRKQEIKQDLAESTLKGKAPRTKALIDSGALVGSITSEVRKRSKK